MICVYLYNIVTEIMTFVNLQYFITWSKHFTFELPNYLTNFKNDLCLFICYCNSRYVNLQYFIKWSKHFTCKLPDYLQDFKNDSYLFINILLLQKKYFVLQYFIK